MVKVSSRMIGATQIRHMHITINIRVIDAFLSYDHISSSFRLTIAVFSSSEARVGSEIY